MAKTTQNRAILGLYKPCTGNNPYWGLVQGPNSLYWPIVQYWALYKAPNRGYSLYMACTGPNRAILCINPLYSHVQAFGACLEQDLLSFIHDLALYSPLLHFVTFWAFYSISHVKVPPKIESAGGFYGSPWGDYLEMTDLCMKIGPF